MNLRARKYLHSGKFRAQHPAARAFLAPQRDREPVETVRSTYVAPKVAKRAYRGSDNPKARKRALTARHLVLGDTVGLRGRAASRRRTARKWEPAG